MANEAALDDGANETLPKAETEGRHRAPSRRESFEIEEEEVVEEREFMVRLIMQDVYYDLKRSQRITHFFFFVSRLSRNATVMGTIESRL